ncbi:MAG: DUF362 domain-containing protein [Candidatus Omnitrophota bacterium]
MSKLQVSIIKCKSYQPDELAEKIKEALRLIGGIEKFIRPGSKVLVKPNLLMAASPSAAITTHPEFTRQVLRLLKGINCKIYIGDGPSVFGSEMENVVKVYEETGIRKIAEEEAVELVTFDKRFMEGYFTLAQHVKDCDYILNLPKFKTHEYMILTGAVKNLFGLIPGTFKLECHKNFQQPEHFAKMLLDVYTAVKPALSIVDGIAGIEGNGPATSGTKRDIGLIVAGSNPVAVDTVLAAIMNAKPENIYTIREALKRNFSGASLNDVDILGESLKNVVIRGFKLPEISLPRAILNNLPGFAANLLKKWLTFWPRIDTDICQSCDACVNNCPQKTMSNKNGKIIIDYSQCISCFCCREVCPYAAIGIKKSFLARLLGK